MAVKGANKTAVEVVKSRKLYTGLGNFKIVAVNPNEKEAEKLGITQTIKDYTGKSKDEKPQIRLDFWTKLIGIPHKGDDINPKEIIASFPLIKLSLFLTDKTLISSAENIMWINKKGTTTWAKSIDAIESNEKMKWYNTTDAREALQGESTITEFIMALLNIDTRAEDVECRLDNPSKIVKGDIKEIKNIVTGWKDNSVQLLLGIKKTNNGTFQDFFKNFFGRPASNTLSAWQRVLADDRNGLGSTGYEDFKLAEGGLEFCEYKISTRIGEGSESTSFRQSNASQDFAPAGDPYGGTEDEAPPF